MSFLICLPRKFPSILLSIVYFSASSLIFGSSSDLAFAFFSLLFQPKIPVAVNKSVLSAVSSFHSHLFYFKYSTDRSTLVNLNSTDQLFDLSFLNKWTSLIKELPDGTVLIELSDGSSRVLSR